MSNDSSTQNLEASNLPVLSEKSFMTTAMLSLFLGGIGIDRFYLGKIGTGILKLITFGGLGFWYLIDIVLVLTGKMKDKKGHVIKNRSNKLVLAVVISILWLALSFGFVVYSVANASPTIELKSFSSDKSLVINEEKYLIEGRIFPSSSTLTINEIGVSVDSDGKFYYEATLAEGNNIIVFKAVDGDKTTTKSYKVYRRNAQEIIDYQKTLETVNDNVDSAQQAESVKVEVQEQVADPRYYWHEVVQVIDGDTVKARVDGVVESIRIIGIDSPESTIEKECYGNESSAKAKEFLTGKWIQLEPDNSQDSRDKYSRLLRYVWFDNGTDFGRRMVEEGYAFEYTYRTPYKYQEQYRRTQEQSKNNKLGLWASNTCDGQKQKTIVPVQQSSPAQTTSPSPAPAPVSVPSPPPTQSSGGVVKKSSTGICHAPGTTYYEKTTNFTSYSSIDACLSSGGRLPLR
jgi:micrococcal nuclease